MSSEAKLIALTNYLQRGKVVLLVDSRQPGVDVPEQLRQQDLTLHLSLRFEGVAIQLTDWGVRVSGLSFNGQISPVQIPWATVWGIAGSGIGDHSEFAPPPEPPAFSKRLGIMGVLA